MADSQDEEHFTLSVLREVKRLSGVAAQSRLRDLAVHPNSFVRAAVARHADAPSDVLLRLRQDDRLGVRLAVSQNPQISANERCSIEAELGGVWPWVLPETPDPSDAPAPR
ncbi:MAG: hypothetical protein ACOC4E_02015 [Patescibacteria group bacterium]